MLVWPRLRLLFQIDGLHRSIPKRRALALRKLGGPDTRERLASCAAGR